MTDRRVARLVGAVADISGIVGALDHLQARLAVCEGTDSRHRPHWTEADMEAVAVVIDRAATREQIALARIEGLSTETLFHEAERLTCIHRIARRALGIST